MPLDEYLPLKIVHLLLSELDDSLRRHASASGLASATDSALRLNQFTFDRDNSESVLFVLVLSSVDSCCLVNTLAYKGVTDAMIKSDLEFVLVRADQVEEPI